MKKDECVRERWRRKMTKKDVVNKVLREMEIYSYIVNWAVQGGRESG